ncbi:MAG: S8 family serine peptidase [Actinobacteria bacterium]|nr:S8 family serine peptidase [Actinomycetota bacterium]
MAVLAVAVAAVGLAFAMPAVAGAVASPAGTSAKKTPRKHHRPPQRVVRRAPASPATPVPTAPAAPNDPLWSQEWGPQSVGIQALWATAPAARQVVVAVVDTGVDPQQQDLAGALVPGWNALTGSSDTHDDNGHGTAVAGVVAARLGNALGMAGYCPTCVVMPVKVMDGSGHGPASAIAAGIDWAVQHGANVLNLSLTLDREDPSVAAAIARAVAAGVVVVAASGNAGPAGPTYPAAEPGVISVSGEDSGGTLYPWSNSGTWVSVAAPGCNTAPTLGGTYDQFCGTSSAAAAVSGIVGAALSLPGASAAAVEAKVTATEDPATHRISAAALGSP